MATNTEQPFHADIMAIYDECQGILNSSTGLARSGYHDALELADAAVDLAEAARLGDGTLRRCRELQAHCLSLLQKQYRVSEQHERDRYNNKSASTEQSSPTPRPAPLAASIVDAVAALSMEDERSSVVGRSSRRKRSITWFDQNPDLHSGVDGSYMINEPLTDLTTLISKLKGPRNRILIPGFYEGILPLTPEEEARFDDITRCAIKQTDDAALYVPELQFECSLTVSLEIPPVDLK
ncbi:hypothetical protein PG991_000444 [Apiospora marii]|uniref:MIT domain-containing protein n=1 Tax=Apiospora marii TaxID=335849 RepID=A0ABR1T3M5_9PEZI